VQSAGLEELLRQVVTRESFDLVIVHSTNMARFLPVLPPRLPRVLDLHVVHSLMAQRAVDRTTGEERNLALYEADRTLRFERHVARRCNLCLTVSEREATAARMLLGIDHVQVIPNGVDLEVFAPGDQPPDGDFLLFSGRLDSAPNIEAAAYFVHKVFPLVRREVPGASFHLCGANPTPDIARLASDTIFVHGRVDDLPRCYRQAAVVVVPLLHGGGTHHKVLEAAASGKAIVSTKLGAEGLDFQAGEHLLVADEPSAFAAAVIRLLRDDRQRCLLGLRARRACRPYEWRKIIAHFCRTIENLVKPISMSRPHALGRPHAVTVPKRLENAPVRS